MAQEFAVSNLIATTIAEPFDQRNPIYNSSNHDYVEMFEQKEYATGATINIKLQSFPTIQRGLATTPSGPQDLTVPFSIVEDDIINVTRELNGFDELFRILKNVSSLTKQDKSRVIDNYGYPAYQAIAADLENKCALKFQTTAYLTPIDGLEKLGAVNTFSAVSQLTTMCDIMKLDRERTLAMNPFDAQAVANSLQNMFNVSINDKITKYARIGGDPGKGNLAGFDIFSATEMQTFFAGPEVGNTGITVTNVASDGTTITLAGVAALTNVRIKAGDRISIPSVNLLSQVAFKQTPYRLVVTAASDCLGDGAGNVVVPLSFPLLVSGEHRNVFTLPAPGAPAFVFPDRRTNYGYTKMGLSTVPLRLPTLFGASNSNNDGTLKVPCHVYMQGLITNITNIYRISALIGVQAFAQYVIELPSAAA